MYTFVKGTLGEKKLQEFARGLGKHIGGFEAAYPPTSTLGPFFKVETGKVNKASNYVHNDTEIKYTEIFMFKPEFNGKIGKKLITSYAILNINAKETKDSLRKKPLISNDIISWGQYALTTKKEGQPNKSNLCSVQKPHLPP